MAEYAIKIRKPYLLQMGRGRGRGRGTCHPTTEEIKIKIYQKQNPCRISKEIQIVTSNMVENILDNLIFIVRHDSSDDSAKEVSGTDTLQINGHRGA